MPRPLSRSALELIDWIKEYGKDIVTEIGKDPILKRIQDLERWEAREVMREWNRTVGEGEEFPIVYGALNRQAKGGLAPDISKDLEKTVKENQSFEDSAKTLKKKFKDFELNEEDYTEMQKKLKKSHIASELLKIAEELEELEGK